MVQIKPKENDLKALVTRMEPGIRAALPKVLTPERFSRVVMTALSVNSDLRNCSQGSFLGAMMQAAQLGMEVNTPLGMAYLIPRKNKGVMEAVFQIGYKGLLDLCYRTGEYRTITAEAVHENDLFEIEYGLHRDLIHKPAKQNRGAVIGYYAVYILKDGTGDFAYMSKDEVQKHREKYSPTKSSMSPWNTNFDAMAKKTVIIKALKYAKKASEIERAIVADGAVKRMDPSRMPDIADIDAAPIEYIDAETEDAKIADVTPQSVPEEATPQTMPQSLFDETAGGLM